MRRHTKSAAQWFSPTDRRRLERALSTAREARLYRRIEAVLLVAYRRAHPDAGRSARHPVSLVAQAGSGTERHGPALARIETAHRCQSAGRLGRCSGQQRRWLGAGTYTPAGAPQGRDDIAGLLAQEPGTRLLATYLAVPQLP